MEQLCLFDVLFSKDSGSLQEAGMIRWKESEVVQSRVRELSEQGHRGILVAHLVDGRAIRIVPADKLALLHPPIFHNWPVSSHRILMFLVRDIEQVLARLGERFVLILSPTLERSLEKLLRKAAAELVPFERSAEPKPESIMEIAAMGTLVAARRGDDIPAMVSSDYNFYPGERYVIVQVPEDPLVSAQTTPGGFRKHQWDREILLVREKYSDEAIGVTVEEFEASFEPVELYQKPGKEQQLPELLKAEFERALAKVDALGVPLFDHSRYDIAQVLLKDCVVNAKPVRMGKTREALCWAKLKGARKVLYVCPASVVPIVVQEMQKIGWGDQVKVLRKISDLVEKDDKWLHVATYDWLKGGGKKLIGRGFPVSCPRCLSPLEPVPERPSLRCQNPACRKLIPVIQQPEGDSYCDVRIHARYHILRRHQWYDAIILDEAHLVKNHTSQRAQMLRALRARYRYIISGTLASRLPSDLFWPLWWVSGGRRHLFPYWDSHKSSFVSNFVGKVQYFRRGSNWVRQAVYYPRNIDKLAEILNPLVIRRSFSDPLVRQSYEKLQLFHPEVEYKTVTLIPDLAQGKAIAQSLGNFEKFYREYLRSLEEQASEEAAQLRQRREDLTDDEIRQRVARMVNQDLLLRNMAHLQLASTYPGALAERNILPYQGPPGGVKFDSACELVQQKVSGGGKVVIFSNIEEMRKALHKALAEFHPVYYRPGDSSEKLEEALIDFQFGNKNVLIASPHSIGLGVDLSSADTVIVMDLLWSMGVIEQAVSRILTPRPEKRKCQILFLLTAYSVDSHLYGLLSSRQVAANQVLDGTAKARQVSSVRLRSVIDELLKERSRLIEWLVDAGCRDLDGITDIPVLYGNDDFEERMI